MWRLPWLLISTPGAMHHIYRIKFSVNLTQNACTVSRNDFSCEWTWFYQKVLENVNFVTLFSTVAFLMIVSIYSMIPWTLTLIVVAMLCSFRQLEWFRNPVPRNMSLDDKENFHSPPHPTTQPRINENLYLKNFPFLLGHSLNLTDQDLGITKVFDNIAG